jgi:hypothetical protein
MANSFKLYTDANLTIEFVPPLVATQNVDGSTGAQDFQFFLGSIQPSKTLRSQVNPGVDPIMLSIVDAAIGTGRPATDIKLALTQGGLAGATAGSPLNLGTSILSGVANKKEIWFRVTSSATVTGTSTELTVQTNLVEEV